MNWYSFLKIAQLWNIDSDGSFSDELEKFYELEYKHSMLSQRPFRGLEQRKENILNGLEKELWDTGENLRIPLLQTFKMWLSSHALMDPGLWAQQRADDDYEHIEEFGEDTTMNGILDEYMKYKNGNNGWYNPQKGPNWDQAKRELFQEIIKNKNNFPSLSPLWEYIKEYQKENFLSVFLEDGGLQEVNRMYGFNFKSEEEVDNNIDKIVESTVDIYDFVDTHSNLWETLGYAGVDMRQFIHEIYQNLIFPGWLKYWKSRGIEKTRKDVENIYKMLQSSNNSIPSLKAGINAALHASHQTGEMIEYLEIYAGEHVDPSLLRELSEGNFVEEWNEELRKIGVEI